MSLPRSTVKVVAAGGLALSTIAVGVVAANASPSALPVLLAATDGSADTEEDLSATESGPHGRGHGGLRGQHATRLAERLGVEQGALEDAVASLRETRGEESRDAMAAALAEELGLDEPTVTAALEDLRAEHRAALRTTFTERLDRAVEEGILTEADKESVVKAFEAGLLGRGPGGRR